MTLSITVKRMLAATTTAVAFVVAVGSFPASPAKRGALEWARALDDSDRVAMAASGRLQQFPVVYRQAIFSTLRSSEERAVAWRGVFEAFRHSHALTEREGELLSRAEALIDPALFAGRRTHAQRQAIAAVRMEIERTMGNDAMRYLYKAFGPTTDVTSAMPSMEWMRWAARTYGETLPLAGRLNAEQDCMCNKAADNDCSYSQHCRSPFACNEREPWWGCGDAEWCDGLCSYDLE